MTKVYLVCSEFHYETDKKWDYSEPEAVKVFTNRKLAEAYAEYWNIKSKTWGKSLVEWRFKVLEKYISYIDYRDDVLKEQMEKLPY